MGLAVVAQIRGRRGRCHTSITATHVQYVHRVRSFLTTTKNTYISVVFLLTRHFCFNGRIGRIGRVNPLGLRLAVPEFVGLEAILRLQVIGIGTLNRKIVQRDFIVDAEALC